MNIVLYGISEELAQRTAMHYGFALCRPFETGTEEENRFWLQPRLENEEELLAFIERMAQHDEQIAAVVAAPTEASTETPMGDFNAVLYATRTDKLFTLGTATGGAVNNAVSDQTPEYELARIIETQLGRVCAHEGLRKNSLSAAPRTPCFDAGRTVRRAIRSGDRTAPYFRHIRTKTAPERPPAAYGAVPQDSHPRPIPKTDRPFPRRLFYLLLPQRGRMSRKSS